jgi:epoxyqueuosine reductase
VQGFDAVGVARPDSIPLAAQRLREYLAAGAHGDMDWMAATAERRGDPRAMWPQARAVVMLGINYGPDGDPLAILKDRRRGGISVYARGDDYHELIKPRLKALGAG